MAKFELRQTQNGKYYFVLKASNGYPIFHSEIYESSSGARRGVVSVQKNSQDDGRYIRNVAPRGEPYFKLKAGNGETLGRSDMYSSPEAMENGIQSVKTNALDAEVVER